MYQHVEDINNKKLKQEKHNITNYTKDFCALSRWYSGMIPGGFLLLGAFGASTQVFINGNVFGGNVLGDDAAPMYGKTSVTIRE